MLSPLGAAIGAAFTGLCVCVCVWIYMELQQPLVAENKTSMKIDGGEILSCHQKGDRKASCVGTVWQSHSDSCEIFPLLTPSWLTVFWQSFLKLLSSQAAPYLWYSLDVQGAFSGMKNGSASSSKLLKSCCLSADEL